METTQTLTDHLFQDGLPLAILGFLVMFVVNKVWPFFTTVYWPAVNEREKRRTSVQESIDKSLTEVRLIAQSTSVMVQQHDALIRQISFALTEIVRFTAGASPPAAVPVHVPHVEHKTDKPDKTEDKKETEK